MPARRLPLSAVGERIDPSGLDGDDDGIACEDNP